MAIHSTRVKIQDKSNPGRYLTSFYGSFPINDVRNGRTIGESHGPNLSEEEAKKVWYGSSSGLTKHLAYSDNDQFGCLEFNVYCTGNDLTNGLNWLKNDPDAEQGQEMCQWKEDENAELELLIDYVNPEIEEVEKVPTINEVFSEISEELQQRKAKRQLMSKYRSAIEKD